MTCYWRWRTQTHGTQTSWTSWFQDTYHRAKIKGSCKQKVDVTFGMTHTCIGYALMAYWGDVCQWWKDFKSTRNAMQHHTEAITEYSAHKPKSSSAGSSGQWCTKTPRCSSEGAKNASCKVALRLTMHCLSTTTYKWRSSMFGALTSWGHSKSPKIVSTSLLLMTTCRNEWKHYPIELLMLGMQGICFMKWSCPALEHQGWW